MIKMLSVSNARLWEALLHAKDTGVLAWSSCNAAFVGIKYPSWYKEGSPSGWRGKGKRFSKRRSLPNGGYYLSTLSRGGS